MLHTARKERAQADTLWMKEVRKYFDTIATIVHCSFLQMVSKQLEVERQRELELDNLYR